MSVQSVSAFAITSTAARRQRSTTDFYFMCYHLQDVAAEVRRRDSRGRKMRKVRESRRGYLLFFCRGVAMVLSF